MSNWLDKYSEETPKAQEGKLIPNRIDPKVVHIEYPHGKSLLYDDKKITPIYQDGGWLGKYDNANESQVSLPPNYVGEGTSSQGRNYSPAWGGQFQDGGDITVAQNGDYLKKLEKNNPKLYKEVQRNNRRIESTNKWNQHFEEEKKKEEAKKWVQNSMQEAYKHPLMQPGYFTPEGAVIGALQGAANMGPDLYNGEYAKAGMDALMMLPLAPNAIKTAQPLLQRARNVGKGIRKGMASERGLVSDNVLPFPPSEISLDIAQATDQLEDLRRAYHNNERFLNLNELRLLNDRGYGLSTNYAPREIQNIFSRQYDDITTAQMDALRKWERRPSLQYNSLSELPLAKMEKLSRLNSEVRANYTLNNNNPEVYNNEIFNNINHVVENYNNLNPSVRINPRLSSFEERIFRVNSPDNIDLRRPSQQFNRTIDETPRNMSGYTKEQTIAMLPEDKADKLAKLSSEEFDKIYVTPKGDIVPMAENYNKPVVHDIHNDEWVESFNSNLPRLNKIIEANNTSGKPYTISNIDKSGNIKFDSEFGSSYFNTNITPGRFSGEIEDIANYQYMRDIPGISMANTSSGVFGPGGVHKGTKAYESINTYLKEMELGRVKAGFNSQTQYSRPLWENAVKADKAVGYYGRPGTVHAVMKTVVPGAIGLGAAEQVIDQKQDGGIIDDDMGQWAHPGKVTRINSNNITMQGVNYPVLGVSDSGDTQMMYPGKDYKFKGKKVTEYPQIAKNGKELKKLDQLTNFTNYNTPQPSGWLDKY